MHYGFKIVEDMVDGLSNWMDEKGYKSIEEICGRAVSKVTKWENLDLNYHLIATIDQDKCIRCELCWAACASPWAIAASTARSPVASTTLPANSQPESNGTA